MKFFFKILLLSFFSLGTQVYAQYFESGQDPSKIKWNQIRTDNFQIIFPEIFEREAQRLANALELVYQYDTKTLHHEPKKISVILHNFSSLGNAFVAWAPKRAEFYSMPPQDVYPQDWLDQLAIHEFRHVVQIDKLNQGFTKILHFILGQQGVAAILGLYVPLWFLEGDAVVAETGLSQTGRGRLPEFEMEMRTQVLGRKIYTYEKAIFDSYKDFVPDHYKLGYLLVANGRKRYGTGIWDHTINYVARNPYNPTPFSHGIKKSSGLNKWKYYYSVLNELDSLWRKQQSELLYSPFTKLNHKAKKVYTNYRYPQWINDSVVLAQKYGLADIEKFVLLKSDGSEEKIFTPGYYNPIWLSAKKNFIVWSEFGFDKRWENRLYYDIIRYDIKTHKRKRLTKKKFLFAPSLSPDASKIVTVEVTPDNLYTLIILDAQTGNELKKISHPDNALLLTPTWTDDGKSIITIILTRNGKAIVKVDPDNGNFEMISTFSFKDISQPVHSGDHIFFHATYSGIENIYAINIISKEVFQITSSVYGAFDPAVSPDGKKLFYSNYSPAGFDIAQIDLRPEEWKPFNDVNDNSIKLYEVISAQEGGSINFDSLTKVTYPVDRYHKFSHLINIHSWSPFYISGTNFNILDPQITVLSQNKLSTMSFSIGYLFNYNERTGSIVSDISYKAWYPIIKFVSTNGHRSSYQFVNGNKQNYFWRENVLGLEVSQPLNYTKGKYSRLVNPSFNVNYRNITNPVNVPTDFVTGKVLSLNYNFFSYNLLKQAKRDMRSRWGQTFLLDYQHSVYGDLKYKSLFSAKLSLLFPGLVKHHSLMLTLAEQSKGIGTYSFVSPIAYVRGLYRFNNREFRRASIDYKFPVLYPDLRLGPILYLQRVKANLFFDYGVGFGNGTQRFNSIGIDITSDLHLLNFIAPLDLGVRYIFIPQFSTSTIQFLYNVNINSL